MSILSSTDTNPGGASHGDPESRLLVYRKRLAALQHSASLTAGNIEDAIREATEIAASILRVERCSVWAYDDARELIECSNLFERSHGRHSSGTIIREKDVPAYFAALSEERCIAVRDAKRDPRTAEFRESYLEPLNIAAMLDVPIWVRGTMVGVICHEHLGAPRNWTVVEELFAGAIADFVARVMEMSDHLRLEQQLGKQRAELEELLSLRTNDLDRLSSALRVDVESWPLPSAEGPRRERDLRELLDASPVPLILSRAKDGVIQYANRRALELFEIGTEELTDLNTADFYVEPSERVAFQDRLNATGRLDGFATKLKTRGGRPFYALMSAQILTAGEEVVFMVGFSDVTAQKLAEIAVRQSEESVRTLFETAPVPLILTSLAERKVILANRRATDLFAVPTHGVVGRQTPDFYYDPQDRVRLMQVLETKGVYNNEEVRLRAADGRLFWALMSGRVMEYEGQKAVLTGVLDVTHQKELETALRELAATDPLTGIANRRAFMTSAEKELARSNRSGQPVSILYLDLDHFKNVNDRYGHAVGDEVLVRSAAAVREELRAIDVFARIGGEEFAILLPDTPARGALALAERIRARIEALEWLEGRLEITTSVGVAQRTSGETLDQLLPRADRALYRAKQGGRNRVEQG